MYQDLGNTCWTFMSPMGDYSKERNTEIVVSALDRLGVQAQASGRNDILVDGRKVSGSAFKLASDRAFHHGGGLRSRRHTAPALDPPRAASPQERCCWTWTRRSCPGT